MPAQKDVASTACSKSVLGCMYTLPSGGEAKFICHAGQRAGDCPAIKVDKNLERKENQKNNGCEAHVNSRVLLLLVPLLLLRLLLLQLLLRLLLLLPLLLLLQ